MKSSTPIVANGGWLTRRTIGRPRARFFEFLAGAWLLVAACASTPFLGGWPAKFGYTHWLCAVLIVLEPVWVALAIVFGLTEQPREITQYLPNPDRDPHNLH